MKTSRTALNRCPKCKHQLDAATAGPDNPDAEPEPGDFTVCVNCVATLVYDRRGRKLIVRLPTTQEAIEAMRDRQLGRVKAAIVAANRQLGRDMP